MRFLYKPHPFIYNIKSVLIPGFSAFLIIMLFAPFKFAELSLFNRCIYALVCGLISSLCVVLVVSGFKRFFSAFMDQEYWTVGKEIVLICSVIFSICTIIFLLFYFNGFSEKTAYHLFSQVVLYTCAISVFPTTILVLYEQYAHERKQVKRAEEISRDLENRVSNSIPLESLGAQNKIQFADENGKIELQILQERILYLQSDGNYVDVYFQNGNKIGKHIIRNRLKSLAETLPDSLFLRTHKSYVVNGMRILKITGNARNYELILDMVECSIPVSRSKSDKIDQFLKDLQR